MAKRSAFYIDGFNLYHAIADLNQPYLKWCNLWKLAQIVIPSRSETLAKVTFCTAYYPGDEKKKWRHEQYLLALQNSGVTVVMGHYVKEDWSCRTCDATWKKPTEKETDINLALSLYEDGANDVYDKAYLVTADSDQAATAKFFKRAFPKKELISVAPPGRNFSSHIASIASGKIALNKDHLDSSVLQAIVMGDRAARRPNEYEPPVEWVHPDNRPQKKKASERDNEEASEHSHIDAK
ncbi:NYN domain-containing protein [Ensifer sp. ENS07]|uniref:NYN domain-containing protein n=1 Tax=unclassified Ensifer TaxID=2633371 RepID=UPI001783A660|nr:MULTISPECIES: NYN domain-containing protein [unclassified Ensifer]MBD9508147.1 NYN domain-containing protein [Ensifer sp. ENS10]MBD9637357.1 NYN domain-containing protein [Ensifer sp. ENS07]